MKRNFLRLLLALLVPGCTFNVSWLDRDITSDGPASFTALSVDTASGSLDDTSIVLRGGTRSEASATAHLAGLIGAEDDANEIASSASIEWPLRESTLGVDVQMPVGPDTVRVETLEVLVPSTTEVTVLGSAGDVVVEAITGRVEAHTDSGTIFVNDADVVELSAGSGSIHAVANVGNLHCGSGSIELTLGGWVVASAGSGSIDGVIGGGGSLATGSGSIHVILSRALDRDLTLSAGSGSIVLTVPRGASMALDLGADSGSVYVHANGVDHEGEDFRGLLGDGGFIVHARAGSGSIHIVEGP